MLVIEVEFLNGTYRADPDGLAPTGRLREGEWPPAPLRLFAALVAADGTRDRCRHTDGSELTFLERCSPPKIFASPGDRVAHQPLNDRYVVKAGVTRKDAHQKDPQEYVGRIGAAIRPGVRMSPASPRVVYAWDVEVPPAVLPALALRAARVGYLGTADSPVRVTVGDVAPDGPLPEEPYVPDVDGDVAIGVPQAGVLTALDEHFDRWTELGPSVSRFQSPGLRRLASYRSPGRGKGSTVPMPTVIWARLDVPVPGRRLSAVTGAFKKALLDRYPSAREDVPAVLHGHGFAGDRYELARFLGLVDVGGRHSRGRIHGLALWLPPQTENAVADSCREALARVSAAGLTGPGFSTLPLLSESQDWPWSAHRYRWTQSARRWATAVPAIYERRVRPLSLEDVAQWCEHAGLPSPAAFRAARNPFITGGLRLSPVEVNRPDRSDLPKLPYCHLELLFESAIEGPVVIGSGRQRGFGLCAPVVSRGHG